MEKILTSEEELKESIIDIIMYGEKDRLTDSAITKTEAILALIRDAGYMSPEMVKGLIFEVQARKCSQCPKK